MKNVKVKVRKSTINRTIKYLLVVFGMWPDTLCTTFCRVFWSVSLGIIQVLQYQYLFEHLSSSDLFDLMDSFSAYMGVIKLSLKFVIFWWNQRLFNEILETMAEDWEECANNDSEMRKIVNTAEISDYIANAIITLHTIAIFFYCSNVILTDVDIKDPTIEIPHLYQINLPFDINKQSTYQFILFMEMIHILMSSCGMGVLNVLLLTLTLHLGGQIDILLSWLTELMPLEGTNKHRSSMIRKIIQKHQKIIHFAENIENLYTFMALLQFATNVMMIGLLGFLIIIALDSPDPMEKILRTLSFYSVTNLEAFIFCYAGEYLTNKSKEIGYAAYDSAWYDMEPNQSRNLLLIILRSQKQLMLTIGKLMDLSLRRFANIMNSAVSYISVLLAMK